MKKFLAGLLLTCCCLSLSAQTHKVLDMKQLQKACTQRKSVYFFPHLLKRYQAFDSTLSYQELQYLYWGQTFYPDYTATLLFPRDRFNRLLDSGKCAEAIQLCDSVLKKHPLDLLSTQYLFMARQECDSNKSRSLQILKRQQALVKAVALTGDARYKFSALPVASIPDEYFFLYFYYGAQGLRKVEALEGYDVLTVVPVDLEAEQKLWFDRVLINNQ